MPVEQAAREREAFPIYVETLPLDEFDCPICEGPTVETTSIHERFGPGSVFVAQLPARFCDSCELTWQYNETIGEFLEQVVSVLPEDYEGYTPITQELELVKRRLNSKSNN